MAPLRREATGAPVVTLGTYDGGLMGYTVEKTAENSLDLKVSFAVNAHVGCVKAIASSPSLLLTGSTDESIRIFSLATRRELGVLTNTTPGTVTCLALVGDAFLLSGDERGRLKLWRGPDWALLRSLDTTQAPKAAGAKRQAGRCKGAGDNAHEEEDEDVAQGRRAVTSLAVHPSGRLALVLTGDASLQIWNLLAGTCAARQALKGEQPTEGVRWAPHADAAVYGLLSSREVSLHNVSDPTRSAVVSVEAVDGRLAGDNDGRPPRWTAFCFALESLLLVGDSNGCVWGVRLPAALLAAEEKSDAPALQPSFCFRGSHASRIKGLELLSCAQISSLAAQISFVSADANGCVHAWSFECVSSASRAEDGNAKKGKSNLQVIQPEATVDTKCRVTCLSSSAAGAFAGSPRSPERTSEQAEEASEDDAEPLAGETHTGKAGTRSRNAAQGFRLRSQDGWREAPHKKATHAAAEGKRKCAWGPQADFCAAKRKRENAAACPAKGNENGKRKKEKMREKGKKKLT
ncbi:WD domain, G-beta repeat-containing protein [Besnoitia besnoiti]|uniref:WD domain, G-beta repeat-containing protein n=1 Tax=Besnoitia besnoiti TaxID=94643 RepID=A0A2A9MLN0_BESBE|nr:WD domain, G-beta repeat-containing protein [Besnoitia besnoiti]PFH36362.1 WD domain, G-beta repeat-containing protein [Besnoitia besnoiti]